MNALDLDHQLSVTLSPKLYDRLRNEAYQLDLPLEWLVASLLVEMASEADTTGTPG